MKKNLLFLFLTFIAFNSESQVTEDWEIAIDSYKHNSTNYSEDEPPIEFVVLSNSDIVVITQNETLAKLDSLGNLIWKKSFKPTGTLKYRYNTQRIEKDNHDNIYIIKDNLLEKYNSDGVSIWQKDFASLLNKKRLKLRAITTDKFNNLYFASDEFYKNKVYVFKINNDGKLQWKRKIKQKIKSWDNGTVPPKEIFCFSDNIYILQHSYDSKNSLINKFNSKGKKREEIIIGYKVANIKSSDSSLFTVGITNLYAKNDKIKILELDENLLKLDSIDYKLPRNIFYSKKAIRGSSQYPPPTKEEYEKNNITSYRIEDFVIDSNNNFLIVGASSNKQWLIKLNQNGELLFNWDKENKAYFKYNNFATFHNQELSRIKIHNDKLLITGLIQEEDFGEERFIYNINLFIKQVDTNN